jgi:hypothetical protein
MIKKGARVNAKDMAGHTPLHHCTGIYANRSDRPLFET